MEDICITLSDSDSDSEIQIEEVSMKDIPNSSSSLNAPPPPPPSYMYLPSTSSNAPTPNLGSLKYDTPTIIDCVNISDEDDEENEYIEYNEEGENNMDGEECYDEEIENTYGYDSDSYSTITDNCDDKKSTEICNDDVIVLSSGDEDNKEPVRQDDYYIHPSLKRKYRYSRQMSRPGPKSKTRKRLTTPEMYFVILADGFNPRNGLKISEFSKTYPDGNYNKNTASTSSNVPSVHMMINSIQGNQNNINKPSIKSIFLGNEDEFSTVTPHSKEKEESASVSNHPINGNILNSQTKTEKDADTVNAINDCETMAVNTEYDIKTEINNDYCIDAFPSNCTSTISETKANILSQLNSIPNTISESKALEVDSGWEIKVIKSGGRFIEPIPSIPANNELDCNPNPDSSDCGIRIENYYSLNPSLQNSQFESTTDSESDANTASLLDTTPTVQESEEMDFSSGWEIKVIKAGGRFIDPIPCNPIASNTNRKHLTVKKEDYYVNSTSQSYSSLTDTVSVSQIGAIDISKLNSSPTIKVPVTKPNIIDIGVSDSTSNTNSGYEAMDISSDCIIKTESEEAMIL